MLPSLNLGRRHGIPPRFRRGVKFTSRFFILHGQPLSMPAWEDLTRPEIWVQLRFAREHENTHSHPARGRRQLLRQLRDRLESQSCRAARSGSAAAGAGTASSSRPIARPKNSASRPAWRASRRSGFARRAFCAGRTTTNTGGSRRKCSASSKNIRPRSCPSRLMKAFWISPRWTGTSGDTPRRKIM